MRVGSGGKAPFQSPPLPKQTSGQASEGQKGQIPYLSVFCPPQTKQRLLLAAREGWAGAAHPRSCVTTSAAAFKAWATLPLIHQTPTEGTIPGADFLPSTTSGPPQAPLIHHQPSLKEGWIFRGLEDSTNNRPLIVASSETPFVVSAVLFHSIKGSGAELRFQSPIFPSHCFSRRTQTCSAQCRSLFETAAGGAVTAWFSLLQFMSWLWQLCCNHRKYAKIL